MKYKLLFFFLFSVMLLNAKAKSKHVIITKNGEEINCRIKNFNVSKKCEAYIAFTMGKSEKLNYLKTVDIKEIRTRKKRYVIAEVDIDNTTNALNKLKTEARSKDFVFSREVLFLEILVEGNASLYRTYLNGIEKFFFLKTPDQVPVQLLYKRYFIERGPFDIRSDYAAEHRRYYDQLYHDLPCFPNKTGKIKYPEFKKSSLIKYFENYNAGNCNE